MSNTAPPSLFDAADVATQPTSQDGSQDVATSQDGSQRSQDASPRDVATRDGSRAVAPARRLAGATAYNPHGWTQDSHGNPL